MSATKEMGPIDLEEAIDEINTPDDVEVQSIKNVQNITLDEEEEITIEDLIRRVEEFVAEDVRDIEKLILPDEDLENFPDPQITSADPYERRVARRLRIRNKLRTQKRQEEERIKAEMGEEENEDEKYDPDNVVENQLESSTVRLLELIQDGRELISNIKVAAVSYEVKRRDKVRLERAERREKLEEAAEEARKKFMEISNQWAAVKAEKDPLDIHAATEDQREKCMDVIAKKDSIIEELKTELEEADLNFVKDLERQEEEINILVNRINQQISIMRTAANTELELLEAAIAVEREEMMKANETEWEEMIDKKEFIESETNVIRNEIMEKHEKSIDAMETDQREQLKIKRTQQTKIIHDLQLQLQEIEALCLFNAEKLNHNYRVLKKRGDENQIIKSQQKRTITKLQDVVSTLRKKMAKKEAALANDTKRMANELASLNRNIKEMEKRASKNANQSNSMFLSVWNFNQSQAEQLLQKIIYADKIMYEQFLDIPAPNLQVPVLKKEDLPSYKEGNKSFEQSSDDDSQDAKSIVEEIDGAMYENRALKAILKSISKYASFLIEENVRDVINNFSPSDQVIIRLDKILTTVGVKNKSEIRLLVKHFLPYLFCKTCQEKSVTKVLESQEIEDEMRSIEEIDGSSNYDECLDNFIDDIAGMYAEKHYEDEIDDTKMDVMEAISSSVKDRITVIDKVVSQELRGILPEQLAPATQPRVSEVTEIDRKRDTIEIIPDDMAHFFRTEQLLGPMQGFISQANGTRIERRHSLSYCLEENHEISIDRLLLIKALCTYSKELNNRTQQKEEKSLSHIITEKWMTVSRSLTIQDIEKFWRKFDIVTKEKEQLWDTFIEGLKEYHMELTERSRLNEEIKKMKRNNNDLLRLLQRYLSISTEESSEMEFPKVKQCFSPTKVEENGK